MQVVLCSTGISIAFLLAVPVTVPSVTQMLNSSTDTTTVHDNSVANTLQHVTAGVSSAADLMKDTDDMRRPRYLIGGIVGGVVSLSVFGCLVLLGAVVAMRRRRSSSSGRADRTSNLESSVNALFPSANAIFPPARTSPFTFKRQERAEYDVPVDGNGGKILTLPKKEKMSKKEKTQSVLNRIKMNGNLCYSAAFAQSGIPGVYTEHHYDVPGSEVTVLPCEYEMPLESSVQSDQTISNDTTADGDACNIYEEIL